MLTKSDSDLKARVGVERSTFSLIRGCSFSFDANGNEAKVWMSAISGMERVFWNGELVAEKRSFTQDSYNKFEVDGDNYVTNIYCESMLNGPWICTLRKNSEEIGKQRLELNTKGEGVFGSVSAFLPFIFIGVLVAIVEIIYEWPREVMVGALVIAVIALPSLLRFFGLKKQWASFVQEIPDKYH